uniref:Uncharacterized protein n=1 Tax=Oryza meridionalis TaxID=40149 RepID=A0A0E0E2H3_9ORYZ
MMMGREDKYVRFEDWRSEQSVMSPRRHNALSSLKERTAGVFAFLGNLVHSETLKRSVLHEKKLTTRTLHPQGPFLQSWNKIFVLSCIFAVSVDPLFFYIPVINDNNTCWYLDKKLEITASVLRFFTDIFYILHIIFQFRTGYIASSPTTFGRGVLVEDRYAIAKRYLSTYFLIDVFAVLPLPQVVILVVLPNLGGSEVTKAKNILMFIVICQYVPRLIRIRPLYLQITRSAGVITETPWAGAVLNLLIYLLASHEVITVKIYKIKVVTLVLGALWYLLSIERKDACWRDTYLQSAHLREEEMRVKSRDTDQWMSYRLLPENLKERIRRHEKYRWHQTSGVDEELLLMNLPKDLRRAIKRHLCLSLLMRSDKDHVPKGT